MSSTGIGFGLAVIFLAIAAYWTDHDNPWRFLDAHGGFMVFAGTAVITVLAIPWEYAKRIFLMMRSVTKDVRDDSVQIVNQLVEMSDKARTDINSLKDFLPKLSDHFLKEAIEVLLEGFDAADIEQILRRRIEVQKERENTDAKMFKNLGKYPPATGLIGTVMGMISLLGSLGQEGGESKVGPSMSVAMAATLYGVILANLVILPIADNLMFRTQKSIAKREMIIEGVLLIHGKTPPTKVRQLLISHLSPAQRSAVVGRKGQAKAA